MASVKVVLDRSQEFDSRGRSVTLGEIVDFFCAIEEAKDSSPYINEEGEADVGAIVAKALSTAYWRVKALDDDNKRRAQKEAPKHVYTARLGDTSKEAAAKLEAARIEAAKLAGINYTPKASKAATAPLPDLAEAMAHVLPAPAPVAPKVPAPKVRKAGKPVTFSCVAPSCGKVTDKEGTYCDACTAAALAALPVKAPKVSAPKVSAPKVSAPKVSAPKVRKAKAPTPVAPQDVKVTLPPSTGASLEDANATLLAFVAAHPEMDLPALMRATGRSIGHVQRAIKATRG